MGEPKYTVTIEEDDEADFGWRLTATHNGKYVLSATDNGEPEDNLFLRDYAWVKPALERAYALGVADGGDACHDVDALLAENAKLRAVAEAARARCRDAVPEWAPELRAALAALEAP